MIGKKLTSQQQGFIKDYSAGVSLVDCYKNNYSIKGKDQRQILNAANQVLNNKYVKQEILRIQEKKRQTINYTSLDSYNKIKEIQELAIAKGDMTNALKAEEMIGRLIGLNKENDTQTSGILAGFKEFYAAICMKKDYGNSQEQPENTKPESKKPLSAICQDSEVIENKE